jgi:hypothetical protein
MFSKKLENRSIVRNDSIKNKNSFLFPFHFFKNSDIYEIEE